MAEQAYLDFAEKLHAAAKKKSWPLRVMFELTYRCNFRCRHCYVPAGYRKEYRRELKTKEVFFILDELCAAGCLYLGFTGGEVFLREDILPILRYASARGFQVIIYTNASLINQKTADELMRLPLNKVDITLPAMQKDTFERITGVKGSHARVFRAIDLLHQRNIALGFKSCLLKENAAQIEEIRDFARSLGALHRLDDILLPRLDTDTTPYRYRGILPLGSIPQEDHMGDCAPDFRGREGARDRQADHGLFGCGAGRSQAAITPSGELKMCLMLDCFKYKILGRPFAAAWRDLRQAVRTIKIGGKLQCRECELKPYCKWCPARGWLHARSLAACDPQSRERAQYLKTRMQGGY